MTNPKIGEVVHLNSSPKTWPMTIEAIDGRNITCVWIGADGKRLIEVFPVEGLMRAS